MNTHSDRHTFLCLDPSLSVELVQQPHLTRVHDRSPGADAFRNLLGTIAPDVLDALWEMHGDNPSEFCRCVRMLTTRRVR
jgi:hypothetical protein